MEFVLGFNEYSDGSRGEDARELGYGSELFDNGRTESTSTVRRG